MPSDAQLIQRAISTIAYAPKPPEGFGYFLRHAERPTSALKAIDRSFYASTLAAYADRSESPCGIYVWPTNEIQRPFPEPAHLSGLPADARPNAAKLQTLQAERLPREPFYEVPESNARYLRTEAHFPSGSTFCLPQRSTNIHYYRTRYPQATFTDRRGWIYATFPGRAGQHLPPKAYRNPPAPATLSTGPRERVTDPETAHVYINRHAPRTHAPANVYPDTATPGAYFFPFPLSTLLHPDGHHTTEAQLRFTYSHGHSVQIHPDADPGTPTTLFAEHRFQPLPVYRQAHPTPTVTNAT